MRKLLLTVLAVSLVSGCTQRIADFTVASTKNMNVTDSSHTIMAGKRVVGKDESHIVLFFPTGMPNMKEAMDNAIEKSPGAVGLSDVTIKLGSFYIPLIYGKQWYEVEGTPIQERK